MKKLTPALVALAMALVACGKDDSTRVPDDLKGDLAMASNASAPARPYANGGVVSAIEQVHSDRVKRPTPSRKPETKAPTPAPSPTAGPVAVEEPTPPVDVAKKEEPVAAPQTTRDDPAPPPMSGPRGAPPVVAVYSPGGFGRGPDGGWGGGGGGGGGGGVVGVVLRGGTPGEDHCEIRPRGPSTGVGRPGIIIGGRRW